MTERNDKWLLKYVKDTEKSGGPAESLARELLKERKNDTHISVDLHHRHDIELMALTAVNSIAVIALVIKVFLLT